MPTHSLLLLPVLERLWMKWGRRVGIPRWATCPPPQPALGQLDPLEASQSCFPVHHEPRQALQAVCFSPSPGFLLAKKASLSFPVLLLCYAARGKPSTSLASYRVSCIQSLKETHQKKKHTSVTEKASKLRTSFLLLPHSISASPFKLADTSTAMCCGSCHPYSL